MINPRTPSVPAEVGREPDGAELASVWARLPEPEAACTPEDTDAAWSALQGRMASSARTSADADGNATSGGDATPARRPWAGVLLRTAAVAVLALGATAAWYAVPVRYAADAGERREISLPDGSRVTLNAGSALRHRRGFSWLPGLPATRRSVTLRGEAFFDVASAVRPFVVDAGTARIRVLGTRFNVRARNATGETRVEVEEGRVEVSDPLQIRALVLLAGEAARVDGASGDLSRDRIDTDRVAAWRSGGMAMADERLADVLAELGLRFDTRVQLLDAAAGEARLSVYYPEVRSLESVLSDLATQQDLRYRRTSDGWELY